MLKEAIEFVHENARSAARNERAQVFEEIDDPRCVWIDRAGQLASIPVPPPLRNHRVASVADFILAAQRWGATGTIWISEMSVTLVCDDADRRDRVVLPLQRTDVAQQVLQLAQHPSLDQAALIQLLKREFAASPQQSTLLAAVRKIKFRASTGGFSEVAHGSESLGKEIEAEVTGAGDIPEGLTLPVAFYGNPGERDNTVTIAFSLDINVQQHRFTLRPLPDELTYAVETTLDRIRQRIVDGLETEQPVFFGQP